MKKTKSLSVWNDYNTKIKKIKNERVKLVGHYIDFIHTNKVKYILHKTVIYIYIFVYYEIGNLPEFYKYKQHYKTKALWINSFCVKKKKIGIK
jgi:hypothetical protein